MTHFILKFSNSIFKASAESDVHETPSRGSSKSQQDRRIDIQPAEDEDGIIYTYTIKFLLFCITLSINF